MLTHARLRHLLSYDPASGVFTWLVRRGRWRAGMRAGTIHAKGYRYIWVDGKAYRASRLAWFYVHGEWPPLEIDHKNLNRADDAIENLRLATRAQNTANCAARANNKFGVKGVSLSRNSPRKPYVAQIQVNKRKHTIGRFETLDLAELAYALAAHHFHFQFARTE